jgi:hypothetical protein
MHYPMFSEVLALDSSKPIMTPIGCGDSCPTKLGQNEGLSIKDHEMLRIMYQCKANQIALWSEKFTCQDSLVFKKNKISCNGYVAAGRCSDDSSPCCACGGGNKVRTYDKCSDKEDKRTC